MRYNIGVIGTGIMGKNHVRVLKNMSDKFNVVGIYDNDRENAQITANMFGINCYDKMDDLLNNVDSVVIAVPSSLHHEIGINCINKGKNVLIEKPLALTIPEGEDLLRVSKDTDVVCMVGHIERYNPVTNELNKILETEEILSIDIHRLSPFDKRIFDTDVAFDLMIHDVDLVSDFIKEDIVSVKSAGFNIYSNTFDYVQALLKYSSRKLVSLTASRVTEDKKRSVEITTKNAYIVADYLNRTITITRKTKFSLDVGYATKYKQENIQEKVFVPMKEPLVAELEHFYDCISNRSTPKTNIANSLDVIKLCKMIVERAID